LSSAAATALGVLTGFIVRDVLGTIARGLSNVASEAVSAASDFQLLAIRFRGLAARELLNQRAAETFTETIGAQVRMTDEQIANFIALRGKLDQVRSRMESLSDAHLLAGDTLAYMNRQQDYLTQRLQAQIPGFADLTAVQQAAALGTLEMADVQGLAAQRSKEMLAWIRQIAVTTPFTVQDLSNTLSFANAMGISLDKSKELTLAIGNFTAGMGLSGEQMQRIIFNFGQMNSLGKIQGRDLRDLTTAMVPVNDILAVMAKKYGVTTERMREMAATGQVGVEEFFDAFIGMANTDFPGAMENMSRTAQGVMGNIKDFIQAGLGADVLGPVFNRLTEGLATALQNFMSPANQRKMQLVGTLLGQTFDRLMPVIGEFASAIGEVFRGLGFGGASFSDFIRGVKRLADFLINAVQAGTRFATWLGDVLPPALARVGEFVAPLVVGFQDFFAAIGENAPNFQAGFDQIISFLETSILPSLQVIFQNIGTFMSGLAAFWRENGDSIVVIATAVFGALAATLTGFVTILSGVLATIGNLLAGDFAGAFEPLGLAISTFFSSALSLAGTDIEGFVGAWTGVWENLGLIVTTTLQRAKEGALIIVNGFAAVGTAMIDAVVRAIQSGGAKLSGAIKAVVDAAIAAVKKLLGIASPSTVFAGFGERINEGLAKGIQASVKLPEQAMALAVRHTIEPASRQRMVPAAAAAAAGGSTDNSRTIHLGQVNNNDGMDAAGFDLMMRDWLGA